MQAVLLAMVVYSQYLALVEWSVEVDPQIQINSFTRPVSGLVHFPCHSSRAFCLQQSQFRSN